MARLGRICPIVAMVGMLVVSTPTQAEYQFEFGHWYGQSLNSHDGGFESCTASLHNHDDQMLLVRFDRDFEISIGVFDDDWSTKLGDTAPIVVWLDHIILYGGLALAIPKDGYYVQLNQRDWSFNLMQNAQKMLFKIEDQSILFELEGVSSALSSLVACVNHERDEHSTT